MKPPLATAANRLPQPAPVVSARQTPELAGQRSDETNVVIRFLLGLMLLLVFSRVTELLAVPGLIFSLNMMLLGYAALTQRWYQTLRNPATVLVFALTVWMGISTAFGMYPLGSLAVLAATWGRSVLIYLAVATLALSLISFRVVTTAIMLACATIVILARFLGTQSLEEGRLVVPTSTLANPNDLATLLLLGIPFTAFVMIDRQRLPAMRVIALVTLVGSFTVIVLTGSRSALVALAALVLLLLAFAQNRARLLLIAVAVAGILLAMLLLPDPIRRRYETLVKSQLEEIPGMRVVDFAEGSEQQRWYLLKSSVVITMRNPLFGVGPGLFADADAKTLEQRFLQAPWRQTHNSYTQVSSECGLPAAVLYVLLLGFCLRTTIRIRRIALRTSEFAYFAGPSLCLLASTLCYAVVAMFSSIAYLPYFPLLAGLTTGLREAARRQLESMQPLHRSGAPRKPALVL